VTPSEPKYTSNKTPPKFSQWGNFPWYEHESEPLVIFFEPLSLYTERNDRTGSATRIRGRWVLGTLYPGRDRFSEVVAQSECKHKLQTFQSESCLPKDDTVWTKTENGGWGVPRFEFDVSCEDEELEAYRKRGEDPPAPVPEKPYVPPQPPRGMESTGDGYWRKIKPK